MSILMLFQATLFHNLGVFMFFIILILSIIVLAKTIGYAIYEYKDNNNKFAAIVISMLAIFSTFGQILVEIISH